MLEDVFKDLYSPPVEPPSQEEAEDQEGAAAEDGAPPPGQEAEANSKQGDAADATQKHAHIDDGEVDLELEDEELESLRAAIETEEGRINSIAANLAGQHAEAKQQDSAHAADMLDQWGLVVGDHVPVPDSKLRDILDPAHLGKEGLLVPRHVMEPMERWIEIKKGKVPHHENLLSISKPEEPNHFKDTASLKMRALSRNIQPQVNEGQKTLLAEKIDDRRVRRPPMPPSLNIEEKEKNKKVLLAMQARVNFLKNPRFRSDRTEAEKGEPCPFWFSPDQVVFRDFQPGGVYEHSVEFKNVAQVGRSLRVLPCKSSAFSLGPLMYSGEAMRYGKGAPSSMIAPGMSAHIKVRFAPQQLGDEHDELTICTELGNYTLPVLALRHQPELELEEAVDCGCVLAGSSVSRNMHVANRGGEGSFRLIADEAEGARYEEFDNGHTMFVTKRFVVEPASFYLDVGQAVDLCVTFRAADVGAHSCLLQIEGDNGEKRPVKLTGIADALRLEMARWPTLAEPLRPVPVDLKVSPWSHVPWQLNWLSPGAQLGATERQTISVSNGGHLVARVAWRLARPPRELLSKLALGAQSRLTEEILKDGCTWPVHGDAEHGSRDCPFSVEPAACEIAPFGSAEFTFSFLAHPPVARRATVFAFLVADEVPANRSCLLGYRGLMDLEDEAPGPPDDYARGLPLAGGFASEVFDRRRSVHALADEDSVGEVGCCTVTAVCLEGVSISPSVTCVQRLLSLSGGVLPFVSHNMHFVLRNSGPRPAFFRMRLSGRQGADESADQLWVVASQAVMGGSGPPPAAEAPAEEVEVELEKSQEVELGLEIEERGGRLMIGACGGGTVDAWNEQRPPRLQVLPGDEIIEANAVRVASADKLAAVCGGLPDGGRLRLRLRRSRASLLQLAGARLAGEWLPLPPPAGADAPGAGALATAAVWPHEGLLSPGEVVEVHVTLRALRESDISSCLMVDLPISREDDTEAAPPIRVDLAASVRAPCVELQEDALDLGVARASAPLASKLRLSNPTDVPVLARIRSRPEEEADGGASAGDIDFPCEAHTEVVEFFLRRLREVAAAMVSGGDVPTFATLPGWAPPPGEGDLVEGGSLVFSPACLLLWPRQSAEVDLRLLASSVGPLRAIVEVAGFDSASVRRVGATADVQSPELRLSSELLHFPVTYAGVPSEPVEIELFNDADLPAAFEWRPPQRVAGGLGVDMAPASGDVPAKGSMTVRVTATPHDEAADDVDAEVPLRVGEVEGALSLRVTARAFGLEVDYAVVPAGELPPEIRQEPRGLDATARKGGSFAIAAGKAPRAAPAVDFGEVELLKSKVVQLVLYNRSGIASPWSLRVEKNPAFEEPPRSAQTGPNSTATSRFCSKDTTGALVAMTFQNAPQPAAQGRDLAGGEATLIARATEGRSTRGSLRTDQKPRFTPGSRKPATGKRKRFLLDDKHEKQAFRSAVGAEFAQLKEERAQGATALKHGRGWAVKVEPAHDVLQPFGKAVVTLTCFSDLPGPMEDELVLSMDSLRAHADGRDFRIPVRLLSKGNPLYLPDQQVGLCRELDPPRLLCGTIVPADRLSTRPIKVSNNSAAKMVLSWRVYGKAQLNHNAEDRQWVNLAVCKEKGKEDPLRGAVVLEEEDADTGADLDEALDLDEAGGDEESDEEEEMPFKFQMWTEQPPDVPDPFAMPVTGELPLKIEPAEAVLPPHGSAIFTVTMMASKATVTADSHYQYKLVGKGRFTEDREALLAAALGGGSSAASKESSQARGGGVYGDGRDDVRALPSFKIEAIDEDDSDAESLAAPGAGGHGGTARGTPEVMDGPNSGAASDKGGGATALKPLADLPEGDVISTLVVDCVGDVIIPRLTVDKKEEPSADDFPHLDPKEVELDGTDPSKPLKCAMFKFMHSCVPHPAAARLQANGTTHGGAATGAQIPGIVSCLKRYVTMTNRNACGVLCRFRIEGPFRLLEIAQVGKHPVRLATEDPKKTLKKGKTIERQPPLQLFSVEKYETISLQAEFVPELVPASQWDESRVDNVFTGSIVVEYPRERSEAAGVPADMQRVHLVATSRRPALRLVAVPLPHLDRPLAQDPGLVMVEFGRTHVDSSVARRRSVLLLNITNVLARWQLVHIGRKMSIQALTAGGEDASALDDMNAFNFDVAEGELVGPSKDVLVPGTGERMPRWMPSTAALPHALPAQDEHLFEPLKVTITFKPKKNELYMSRFRMHVEGGISADFICRGQGSYNEEDDCLDFVES